MWIRGKLSLHLEEAVAKRVSELCSLKFCDFNDWEQLAD